MIGPSDFVMALEFNCDFRFFFHSFVIFCLPYLFSFVRCSIRERWRGSLFQLPFVGISWIYLCLRSSNPSLCFFKIMGSIDCTWMWYGWLFVHWTSGMEKKQTAIIWIRKKKEKKIRKIRKKCPFLTNRNLIYLLFLQWKKWNTKHNIYTNLLILQYIAQYIT